MINVAVINATTILLDDLVAAQVAAVQVQIDRDWTPVWGIPARLTFVERGAPPPGAAWWLTMLDTADAAGALGYHDLTTEGLPLGKVFAATTIHAGDLVSVTLSHEVLEILADPDVNLLVQEGTRFYAYEVCDPVEADTFGYDIDNLRVSDFVLPAYFETVTAHPPGTKWDFAGKLAGPLPTMLAGGYLAYLEHGTWTQDTARATPAKMYRALPQLGSRRYRRTLPPYARYRSTVACR